MKFFFVIIFLLLADNMNTIIIFICRYKLIEAASNAFILELGNFDKYGGIYLITKCCIEYTSPRTGFGPTTLVINTKTYNHISGARLNSSTTKQGRLGRDRMVVGFTTTCAISAYHH
jgi:hypothetical protein